ncbi:hypothetical protein [Bacillus cereus]|nr:hypothetical protein [Bacillus cereus]
MKKLLPVALSVRAVALLGSMFEVGDVMYVLQKTDITFLHGQLNR